MDQRLVKPWEKRKTRPPLNVDQRVSFGAKRCAPEEEEEEKVSATILAPQQKS